MSCVVVYTGIGQRETLEVLRLKGCVLPKRQPTVVSDEAAHALLQSAPAGCVELLDGSPSAPTSEEE